MTEQRQQPGDSTGGPPHDTTMHQAPAPEAAKPLTQGRSPDADLLNALSGLDRIDRLALRLIYWRGLTQTEVARELGLPLATIRECVARGMRELAQHIIGYAR